MPTDSGRDEHRDDELPDAALFWRWAAKATRPVVGWVFVGVGALLVIIGWFGVSRESIVAKQLPFLISGGIGGVLLAVIGAYFLGTEELRKDSGRLDRLERMVEELHAALLSRPDAPAVSVPDAEFAPAEPTPSNGRAQRLVVLPGSERYHRADCVMVEGKAELSAISSSSAKRKNLEPCPLCEPVAV